MQLNLVNIDTFCEDLPEVDNPKVFESGKFSKNGLFSQQIFGPLRSYYCACTKSGYRGRNSGITTCEACKVNITTSETRRRSFGKISLPFEILNPLFYYVLCMVKPSYKNKILNMLNYRYAYVLNDDKLDKIDINNPPPSEEDGGPKKLEGLSGVLGIIDHLIEQNDIRPEIQFLRDNFNNATINNIIVIPPDFRPCGKNQTGTNVSDEINQYYSFVIVRSNHMKSMPYSIRETDDVFRSNFKHIQSSALKLYDYVLSKLSKKKGLIRSNILGKRVDFSGRAVISPDPNLTLDTCGLPYLMLLEILKPQFVSHLVKIRHCKRYNQANKIIDDAIREQDDILFEYMEDFCKDKMCVLNRQPTLHRLGVLAFKIKPHMGNTVQIHPMVCSPYNADFDGDAMAVYFPITEGGNKDVMEKVGIWKNLVSPTDLKLVPTPNQDIILGIWAATTTKNKELKKVKGEELPFELALFNECLPEDYPIQKLPQDEKRLRNLLDDIVFRYGAKTVMNTLDKIKKLGFMLSTYKGYTLGINDMYSPELIAISKSLSGKVEEDMALMNNKETMKKLKQLKFADYINSGARGSWDQVKQLVLSRGYVADASGSIRKDLIRSSLVEGLSPQEFCHSSWGARKGLLDTAMSTGDSGYLTRQLIYSTVNVELDEELDDCGTQDTLTTFVEDEKKAKSILWRYHKTTDGELKRITRANYKELIGKTINLRSPIYCQTLKMCKKCYGDLYKILHSDQIGIVATQAIGERTTQLVLRTFHTSGVAQTNESGDQEDIISGMALANKIFHSPENILSNVEDPAELANMLYKLFNPYKQIHMIHYEIIVSAMMWYEKNPWRLTEDRLSKSFKWVSILKIPEIGSWLLGAAFSNLKNALLNGLIYNRQDDPSSLSKLFRF